jgi:hypothetical protein
MSNSEKVRLPSGAFGLNMGADYNQPFSMPRGEFHLQLVDDMTGSVIEEWVKPNTLTNDAGRFAAWLFSWAPTSSNKPLSGLNGLAIGTGTISTTQTKQDLTCLANEVARVQVGSVSFIDPISGTTSIQATRVLDFKFTIGATIADNEPLKEMGLVYVDTSGSGDHFGKKSAYTSKYLSSDASIRATQDIRGNDILINYLDFGTITKPPNSTLNITWRLTF